MRWPVISGRRGGWRSALWCWLEVRTTETSRRWQLHQWSDTGFTCSHCQPCATGDWHRHWWCCYLSSAYGFEQQQEMSGSELLLSTVPELQLQSVVALESAHLQTSVNTDLHLTATTSLPRLYKWEVLSQQQNQPCSDKTPSPLQR